MLSANTRISWQTERHSFGDLLITQSVLRHRVLIEASIVLCSASLWLVWVNVQSQPALWTPVIYIVSEDHAPPSSGYIRYLSYMTIVNITTVEDLNLRSKSNGVYTQQIVLCMWLTSFLIFERSRIRNLNLDTGCSGEIFMISLCLLGQILRH
jgi:hypothetical protein